MGLRGSSGKNCGARSTWNNRELHRVVTKWLAKIRKIRVRKKCGEGRTRTIGSNGGSGKHVEQIIRICGCVGDGHEKRRSRGRRAGRDGQRNSAERAPG